MRRFPFVIGATAATLAGVLSFHTSGSTSSMPVRVGALGRQSSTTTPTAGTGPSEGSSAGASTTTPLPDTATTAPVTVSATGATEQYGYGVISVKVSVSGSQITAVTVASLQTAESYSQQLAQRVIPVLRGEVLSAQSANITAVSGATYTSQAYATSVQSALDSLHR